jgi:hypothetical protein
VLKEGTHISINPLVIWAWDGLLINDINSIPAGSLMEGESVLPYGEERYAICKLNIILKWNLELLAWLCYCRKYTFRWLISWKFRYRG